jgi:hypothetical protein
MRPDSTYASASWNRIPNATKLTTARKFVSNAEEVDLQEAVLFQDRHVPVRRGSSAERGGGHGPAAEVSVKQKILQKKIISVVISFARIVVISCHCCL